LDAFAPLDVAGERVVLVVPASSRNVRLARLVTSGVGSAAGFDVDEIDDLRIAVDEVCSTLLETTAGSTLRLSFHQLGDVVTIDVTADGPPLPTDGDQGERAMLTRQILSVVVDHCQRADEGDGVRYRLVKQRSELSS